MIKKISLYLVPVLLTLTSGKAFCQLPGYQDIKDPEETEARKETVEIKTAKRFVTDLGGGANTSYGIFGAGAKYFILQNLDLHFSLGFSAIGSVSSIGGNFYFWSQQVAPLGDEFNLKLYGGASLISTNGAKLKKITNLQDADYQIGKGLAVNPVIGAAGLFVENIWGAVELGYRSYSKKPEVTFENGFYSAADQEDIEKSTRNDLSFLLSVGWLW
jgi:hypothetical protein